MFWVHASNAARYTESFRVLADQVKIPGRQNPKSNIFELVGTWLRSDESGKWVIILDNIDEAGFLFDSPSDLEELRPSGWDRTPSAPLVTHLPRCQHGSVLITSRSKHMAQKLVEDRNIIVVEPMSRADALALMESKLGRSEKTEDVEMVGALALALEYMPLAIVQATSYIAHRAPRISVQQFLEKLQQSDRKKASLLNYADGQLRRDREASNSIILTWQISFDHVHHIRPSAADLLSLMSFCDGQGIPEALLQGLNEHRDDKRSGGTGDDSIDDNSSLASSTSDSMEEDIRLLRDYSFISINEDELTFEMHNLVQLSMQRWLKAQGQQDRWRDEFISRLSVKFPQPDYENWQECRLYLPHARAAAEQQPKTKTSCEEWAAVMYRTAGYLLVTGLLSEAQRLAEKGMETMTQLCGRSAMTSMLVMHMLALIYGEQGRFDDAEKLLVEFVKGVEAMLGADHPPALSGMNDLAITYGHQGRYDEARKLHVKVLESRKIKLGVNHPATLYSMDNLAITYSSLGRYHEAEKLHVKVLENRK